MLKFHLAAGLMLGIASAIGGLVFGLVAWEVLSLYALGGTLGLLGSVIA